MTSSPSSGTGNDVNDKRPSFLRDRRDPGAFIVPVVIKRHHVGYGIIDSGTEISSLPIQTVKQLGLLDEVENRPEVIDRDGLQLFAVGRLKHLPVTIGKLEFKVTFTIMRGRHYVELITPIILGRIFLAQASAEIDFRNARLLLSSYHETEIHNLQEPELEWKNRGEVRPLFEEVTQKSNKSKSRKGENQGPTKGEESEPEVNSRPKRLALQKQPREVPHIAESKIPGLPDDIPGLTLRKRIVRVFPGSGSRPKRPRTQSPDYTPSPEVPDYTPSPMT